METIISGVIVLCMFYQEGIIEHTYIQDQKMSSCLKAKRQVERSVNPQNVRMQCGEVDAILEEDKDTGRIRVVKIVKDKYDSSGYTK
jgi:Holliday junction resolvase-like predicted endonuclease